MITKTVLPFKLEPTSDAITSHAGLALLGEFAHGLGLSALVDRHVAMPGSGAGYRPSGFVLPLVLMLNGGGRSLEDLREVRRDLALRELPGWDRLPSSDAVGGWLRRTGRNGGLWGLDRVNRAVLDRALRDDGIESYTLDLDATAIAAGKGSARMTYKGYRGCMPMVGHLAGNGLVVFDEFREGNDSPGSRNLEFLRSCCARMPEGKRIGAFRSDSAAYQASVLNYCEREGMEFAVGADLDSAVLAYNLFRLFELKVLPEDWHRHQIRTVRWRLYQVAGKVVRHAGQVYLKVRQAYYGLFEMIRRRIRMVAMA